MTNKEVYPTVMAERVITAALAKPVKHGENDIIVRSGNEEKKVPARHGQKEYKFPDGFRCFAINQKNANRKFKKWYQNKEDRK